MKIFNMKHSEILINITLIRILAVMLLITLLWNNTLYSNFVHGLCFGTMLAIIFLDIIKDRIGIMVENDNRERQQDAKTQNVKRQKV